jgi:hypothetical protein
MPIERKAEENTEGRRPKITLPFASYLLKPNFIFFSKVIFSGQAYSILKLSYNSRGGGASCLNWRSLPRLH